jgi:hypothetical protein
MGATRLVPANRVRVVDYLFKTVLRGHVFYDEGVIKTVVFRFSVLPAVAARTVA